MDSSSLSPLPLPTSIFPFVEPYLPPDLSDISNDHRPSTTYHPTSYFHLTNRIIPFITLRYTQSLDSKIYKESYNGIVETQVLTHYLRSKHDAILVPINTVLLNDPDLTCQFNTATTTHTTIINTNKQMKEQENQYNIKPVIIDPEFKFRDIYCNSKIFKNCKTQNGLSPIIVISELSLKSNGKEHEKWALENGITLIALTSNEDFKMSWFDVFKSLKHLDINSIIIEGGATIINDLLNTRVKETNEFVVSSLIISVGPTYLGKEGVNVSPPSEVRLVDISWWSGKKDSVLCAKLNKFD